MTGEGEKVWDFFPFWRFAQEGPAVEQPGGRELAPSRERQAAQLEKRSKNSDFISLVFVQL